MCVRVCARACVRMYNVHVNNVWHTQKHSPCPSDHASDTELEMGHNHSESTVNRWCAVYVSCYIFM